jgi:hypothetical protein
MSYSVLVEMTDYQGRKVELSDVSWEHIRESHPEITQEDIRQVLAEVRESPRQSFVELFYQTKTHPRGKDPIPRRRR